MSYLIAIKSSILVFPFIAFLFTIPFILYNYHKYGSINPFKTFIIYSFILYMLTVYFLVILPLPKIEEVVAKPNMIRLVPFGFIKDIMNETSFVINEPHTYLKALTEPCFYTVIFNIFMTIPFGMYLRYYFKYDLKKTIFYSFLLSLFFEVTQITGLYFIYPHPYRVFDIDDLLTNTLGGIIGYAFMGILDNYLPTRDILDAKARKAGEEVSGLRRITLFFLDFFLYLFLSMITSIFFSKYHPFLLSFLMYYILIPLLKKGHTLGGSFLHVKIECKNVKIIRLFLRILFLYLYYFIFPFLLFVGTYLLVRYLEANVTISIYFYLISMGTVFLFYLINGFIIITTRKTFYDDLLKVNYRSTLKKEEDFLEPEELKACGTKKYKQGYRVVYFYNKEYKISTWVSKIKYFMMDFVKEEPIESDADIEKFISVEDLLDRYLEEDKKATKIAIYKVDGTLIAKKEREDENEKKNGDGYCG